MAARDGVAEDVCFGEYRAKLDSMGPILKDRVGTRALSSETEFRDEAGGDVVAAGT
jgi:hypothetical protein